MSDIACIDCGGGPGGALQVVYKTPWFAPRAAVVYVCEACKAKYPTAEALRDRMAGAAERKFMGAAEAMEHPGDPGPA